MSGLIKSTEMRPLNTGFDPAQWGIPHPSPFVCELSVTSDQIGRVIEHVSNIEVVRWIDRVAELHSDSVGYTRARLLDQRIMWFVARHEIDYLAEAWLNDELIVATWVHDFRKVRSWRRTVIVRPADARVICQASTLWVLVDLGTRRPRLIPQEMRARFQVQESTSSASET